MNRARILSVVGARPNFIKLAPVERALARRGDVEHVVVHTGQHYDDVMSGTFFHELDLAPPQYNLGVGSGTPGRQIAGIMCRFEPICAELRPDIVLVYGDVNSTLAATLVAAKLGFRVGHVEAGLRSDDWTMPEEANRLLTDVVSDLLFAPSRDAVERLVREGVSAHKIHFVGNVMIDTLVQVLPRARALDAPARHGVPAGRYVVATLHRPSNVDRPDALREILEALATIGREMPVIFPVHPRTRARLGVAGLEPSANSALRLVAPLGYLEMLGLVAAAAVVVTDSGGLQEETSYLGVPCLTVRPNTERPITCTMGTNRLVEPDAEVIVEAARAHLRPGARCGAKIERWDGDAAERIAKVLLDGAVYG